MAKKGGRVKIRLVSEESSHFYTTDKNPRTLTEKLQLRKFDPTLRKYVLYKEAKIK